VTVAQLAGKTCLITGANTGIGLATATELARRGGRVYLACRSRPRGEAAVAQIAAAGVPAAQVRFLPLDLADLASVRACAREFLAAGEPLHVLLNNAGISGPPGKTADGFEVVFGVNHLGHYALTMALLEPLQAAGGRVVTVASKAHYQARGIDFARLRRRTRGITGIREYQVSKLCNVLFTRELARRLEGTGVSACALHPGVVASDIWRRVPAPARPLVTRGMLSTEDGAATSLYCATAPASELVSGGYYDSCELKEPSALATAELAGQLWSRSEAWTRPAHR
jgi:NAD(P)-dependent dehydrogenase (short-subunit alcohol dehydrogenase family)